MVMSDYLISSSSFFASTAANLGHTLWFVVSKDGASARQANLAFRRRRRRLRGGVDEEVSGVE